MLPQTKIKKPFVFNLLKHHTHFVQALFEHYSEEDENELVGLMRKGGNLWCDYYYGGLSPDSAIKEVTGYLIDNGLFEIHRYSAWINGSPQKFRNIFLSDGSEWTLLCGTESERYIHIHPARYSKFTIRVRFVALKTAILALLFYGDVISDPDYEKINFIRQKYISASPLKIDGDISHLKKITNVIRQTVGRGGRW